MNFDDHCILPGSTNLLGLNCNFRLWDYISFHYFMSYNQRNEVYTKLNLTREVLFYGRLSIYRGPFKIIIHSARKLISGTLVNIFTLFKNKWLSQLKINE